MPLEDLLKGLLQPAGPGGTILSSPLASIAGLAASIADPRFAPVFKSTVLDMEKLRMDVEKERLKSLLEQQRHEEKMALGREKLEAQIAGRKATAGISKERLELEKAERAREEAVRRKTRAALRLFQRGISPGLEGREPIAARDLRGQLAAVLEPEALEGFLAGTQFALSVPPIPTMGAKVKRTFTDPQTGEKITIEPEAPPTRTKVEGRVLDKFVKGKDLDGREQQVLDKYLEGGGTLTTEQVAKRALARKQATTKLRTSFIEANDIEGLVQLLRDEKAKLMEVPNIQQLLAEAKQEFEAFYARRRKRLISKEQYQSEFDKLRAALPYDDATIEWLMSLRFDISEPKKRVPPPISERSLAPGFGFFAP